MPEHVDANVIVGAVEVAAYPIPSTVSAACGAGKKGPAARSQFWTRPRLELLNVVVWEKSRPSWVQSCPTLAFVRSGKVE